MPEGLDPIETGKKLHEHGEAEQRADPLDRADLAAAGASELNLTGRGWPEPGQVAVGKTGTDGNVGSHYQKA